MSWYQQIRVRVLIPTLYNTPDHTRPHQTISVGGSEFEFSSYLYIDTPRCEPIAVLHAPARELV